MAKAVEQRKKKHSAEHLAAWQFKKGQSGNPKGRHVGSVSLKEYAKKMLAGMTEEERMEYMHGLSKEFIWKMAEGNPDTKTDLTSGGDKVQGIIMLPHKDGHLLETPAETDTSAHE